MEQSLVLWEMMELLPIKTLVVSHVILVMSSLVVILESVRVMVAGVALRLCVEEVCLLMHITMTYQYFCIVSCPSLNDPNNGVMTCSLGDDGVPSYKDTCTFICNVGYLLTGSDFRTCQSDGSWSGSDTMCRKGETCVCICFNCMQIEHVWHLAPVR